MMDRKKVAMTATLLAAAIGLTALADGTNGLPLASTGASCDPATVGRRIMAQFLSTEPCDYKPVGYDGDPYGGGKWLPYALASWWANGIDFALATDDDALRDNLIARYRPYLKGGRYERSVSRMYHVDDTIAGIVPCAISIANGDAEMKRLGLLYADTQWTPPCEMTYAERHAAPKEVQKKYWEDGFTPQTRLWIDDMYMIIAIQAMAYRLTGDRKYVDRAAKEMCLYLDKLQLKTGAEKGLFYHAPDVPYVWGRGNGWMAAGMALLLSYLDEANACRQKILHGYREMMAALLRFQRKDGLWGQLVNEPTSWGESSGSAMFTYAYIMGSTHGWLNRDVYLPAARKAWEALCAKLDSHANISDVCIGTGKKNNHQYYLDRRRINGDPHGEAPMMWCVNAWLEEGVVFPSRVAARPVSRDARLFFAGDSTLDDYGRKPHPPYASWGTELESHMQAPHAVVNFARCGESTKSFIGNGHWQRLVDDVRMGDFVAIQFGHNDQKWYTPFYLENRFADPEVAYRVNLRKMVADVRAKGATPLLLTPIVRGNFDGKGQRLVDGKDSRGICLASYAEAVRDVGRELMVDVVDMNKLTRELLERVGKDAAMKYFAISSGLAVGKDGEPSKDVTHPVAAGAKAFARLFIEDVSRRKLSVSSFFVGQCADSVKGI